MALILKRASASRPSGEWGEDDYDVLAAAADKIAGAAHAMFHETAPPAGRAGLSQGDVGMWETFSPHALIRRREWPN
jgi:hypothetical protein